LWFYAPELRHKIYYAQIIFHGLVLMNLVFWLFSSHQKVNTKLFGGFLMAVLVILITNLFYGLDALYLHWRYSFIESLVGLGNGTYLFFVTKGALRYVKKGRS